MSARGLLEQEHSLDRLRGFKDGDPRWDRGWWAKGAELGWAAALVPEELGGGSVSGAGVRDLVLLAEELGASIAPSPLLTVNVVLAGLVAAQAVGPDHAVEIASLASGESIGTWAVYERGAEWAPHDPKLTATPNAGGFLIEGTKDRVENADQADLLLVTAKTPNGVSQFLVPTDLPGVTVTPQVSLDLSRSFGEVSFRSVHVAGGAMVGQPGATDVIDRQLQIALLIQCAEVCGGLDRVFQFTTQWMFDRFTFGRPLASYQALKHRIADDRTWLEGCHATTQAAAAAVQAASEEATRLVSIAKAYVGDRSLMILQDCVQIHGGIGVTWEHDLHLYLRRATVNQALYGTPEDHRRRLADLISL